MQTILKSEEAAMALLAIYFLTLYNLGISWWGWILLFFLPDIGMLGYFVNNKIGAICYNILHHKGLAIIIAMTGFFFHRDVFVATGLLLFAHSSFDRMLGYGLKYFSNFKDTHLGKLPGGNTKSLTQKPR
jgi:hypothetical protein